MMNRKRTVRTFAAAAVLGMAAPALAAAAAPADAQSASQPTTAQLMDQIKQLQTKVELMQGASSQPTMSKQDVDAAVQRVLTDADHRSQLLAVEGFTAGFDKGRFRLASADGSFSFQPNFYAQIRNVTNYSQDTGGPNDDELVNGFELRRARFGFDGNLYSKNLEYYFQWDSNRAGGAVTLWQAYAKFKLDGMLPDAPGWAIRAGQFVNPISHEQAASSKNALGVDRSLSNSLIMGVDEARMQGAELSYDQGPIIALVGVGDGFNSNNTDFTDAALVGGQENFNVFGRVNFFIMGQDDHKSYSEFSAEGNKNDQLVVGAGLDYTQDGDVNHYRHTADIQYKMGNHLSLYGAYLADYVDGPGANTYNWGLLAQAGYCIDNRWEPFARYSYTHFDNDVTVNGSTKDSFNEITVGVNYYLWGQNAKFTVDASWLPDGCPTAQTGLGYLASGDDEFVLRAQFQLAL